MGWVGQGLIALMKLYAGQPRARRSWPRPSRSSRRASLVATLTLPTDEAIGLTKADAARKATKEGREGGGMERGRVRERRKRPLTSGHARTKNWPGKGRPARWRRLRNWSIATRAGSTASSPTRAESRNIFRTGAPSDKGIVSSAVLAGKFYSDGERSAGCRYHGCKRNCVAGRGTRAFRQRIVRSG